MTRRPARIASSFISRSRSWLILGVALGLVISVQAVFARADGLSVFLPLVALSDSQTPKLARYVSVGSPIAVAASGAEQAVWVVNPDADTVSVVDGGTLRLVAEIPVGHEPWSLALDSGRFVYVVNRADGTLSRIDALRRVVLQTVSVGPEPISVALAPGGGTAFVTIGSASEIAVVDTAQMTVTGRIAVRANPHALAVTAGITGDDTNVWVTHFLALARAGMRNTEATDDGREGVVSLISARALTVTRVITLPPSQNGFPNLLGALAFTPSHVWLPHVRAMPALPNSLTTTVFSSIAAISLDTHATDAAAEVALNGEVFGSPVNDPVAAAPSPDGKRLYVVAAGSNVVEVVDIADPHHAKLVGFLPGGLNPRGIALNADGTRAFVMSYLSRSIIVLDLAGMRQVTEVPVTHETLPGAVLRGKVLFNTAANLRLSTGGWISCASCHPDGAADGVTWRFPDGPRQTPPLWNAANTLPWHWSGTMDEMQDVDETVRNVQFGTGLGPIDHNLLGKPNAGRSADLDALAQFIAAGIRTPNVITVTLSSQRSDVAAGRQKFSDAGCAACHGGPNWTVSALPGPAGTLDPDGNGMIDSVLRDVGTLNADDIRGQTGFDVPSLLNVSLTAPYLHDGSAPTLEALLRAGHPTPRTGNTLTPLDIRVLVAFLNTIGPNTRPVPLSATSKVR